jgi:hypothetical protein
VAKGVRGLDVVVLAGATCVIQPVARRVTTKSLPPPTSTTSSIHAHFADAKTDRFHIAELAEIEPLNPLNPLCNLRACDVVALAAHPLHEVVGLFKSNFL